MELYQRQQVKEEVGVLSDQIVSLTAQVHEQLETAGGSLTTIDDVGHIGGQDKRCAVPEGEKRLAQITGRPYVFSLNQSLKLLF